jgi:hypothetical protein
MRSLLEADLAMATKPKPSALTQDHFMAFGAIVHQFARHEYLMQCLMNTVVRVHITPLSMLTVELSYRARRETLLSLIRAKPLPKKQLERIESYLAALHKHNGLRNAIAHQLWKEGTRNGTVRPFGLSVRGGNVAIKGIIENEQEYTENDLIDIANELAANYDKFRAFLQREELFKYIPRKVDASSSDTSSSPGIPSAK